MIKIVNEDGTSYMKDGGTHLRDIMKYFEDKGNMPYYKMCSEIKKHLDEYYQSYPQKIPGLPKPNLDVSEK